MQNTYDRPIELDPKIKKTTWAHVASITGDKASFHHCSFTSLHDTLHAGRGLHYLNDCFMVRYRLYLGQWPINLRGYENSELFSLL